MGTNFYADDELEPRNRDTAYDLCFWMSCAAILFSLGCSGYWAVHSFLVSLVAEVRPRHAVTWYFSWARVPKELLHAMRAQRSVHAVKTIWFTYINQLRIRRLPKLLSLPRTLLGHPSLLDFADAIRKSPNSTPKWLAEMLRYAICLCPECDGDCFSLFHMSYAHIFKTDDLNSSFCVLYSPMASYPLEYVVLVLGALALALFYSFTKARRYPPGPPGIPVLGNLHKLPKKHRYKYFHDISKSLGLSSSQSFELFDALTIQYIGNLIYFHNPFTSVLAITSYRSMQDLLTNRASKYSGRPGSFIVDMQE